MIPLRWHACLIAGLITGCGCAVLSPRPTICGDPVRRDHAPDDIVVVRGTPHKRLDRVARALGARDRLTSLNSQVDKHEVSPATVAKLKAYLVENRLSDVGVYVNHYDPKLQWSRLRNNTLMAPPWRFTLGSLDLVNYTLFPGRIFGGDRYDPYTNSLYLNSDVPAIVLHEAAYAKDVHRRKLRGAYVVVNELPVLGVWRHSRAIRDVLGYARAHHDWELERSTYHVVYPRTGAEIASAGTPLLRVWWGGAVLGLGGAACGHVTGRTIAAYRGAQREAEQPSADRAVEARTVSYETVIDESQSDFAEGGGHGKR